MYAIEFESKIKDGIIKIPQEYQAHFGEEVRVILLAKEEASNHKKTNRLKMFETLCGAWSEKNNLTLETLREKAWKR